MASSWGTTRVPNILKNHTLKITASDFEKTSTKFDEDLASSTYHAASGSFEVDNFSSSKNFSAAHFSTRRPGARIMETKSGNKAQDDMSLSSSELEAKLARNKAEVDAVAARMQADMAKWRETMSADLKELKSIVAAQNQGINSRLDSQSERIESAVNAQSVKIDAALSVQESKLDLKLSDLKIDIIKWVLGLPALSFALYKIYSVLSGNP